MQEIGGDTFRRAETACGGMLPVLRFCLIFLAALCIFSYATVKGPVSHTAVSIPKLSDTPETSPGLSADVVRRIREGTTQPADHDMGGNGILLAVSPVQAPVLRFSTMGFGQALRHSPRARQAGSPPRAPPV